MYKAETGGTQREQHKTPLQAAKPKIRHPLTSKNSAATAPYEAKIT